MTNESAALAILSAVILALSLVAAAFWLRERRAKEEAKRRAYRHGLAREADLRSHATRGHGGRGGSRSSSSSSSSSNSDAGYPGIFAFPGLGDSGGGRSDHSDTSSSHSSSCSSSSCGGGGGD